jgi:glycosyltransferase involved in cell wall biosynthesis
LIDSFPHSYRKAGKGSLVIVGGTNAEIEHYRRKCRELGIGDHVHFLGPRPVECLGDCLMAADILVSPRIKGKNTPMKIYSYLHSGKAVLATDVASHREVLGGGEVAALAAPSPEEFGGELAALMGNELLRKRLGNAGRNLAEANYSYESFRNQVNALYDWLQMTIPGGAGSGGKRKGRRPRSAA